MTPVTVLHDKDGGREFRLVRPLGVGGFGEVYLAEVRSPGGLMQQVAVKLLLTEDAERKQAVARLREEAAVLTRLRHPVILVAHDLVELGGRIGLVTEYVEGQDLRQCLDDRRDRIPLAALLDTVGQVASALDAAWTTAETVHRDIKPSNIRIGRHANIKLLDFGLARSGLAQTEVKTQTNVVMGSLLYLSPERFELDRAPHPASDIFSLGCVLYEGMAGARLFHAADPARLLGLLRQPAALRQHVEHSIDKLGPSVPDRARELLRSMLRWIPNDRTSAGDVARELDLLAATLSPEDSLRAWCRRRDWGDPTAARGTSPRSVAPRQSGAASPLQLEDQPFALPPPPPGEGTASEWFPLVPSEEATSPSLALPAGARELPDNEPTPQSIPAQSISAQSIPGRAVSSAVAVRTPSSSSAPPQDLGKTILKALTPRALESPMEAASIEGARPRTATPRAAAPRAVSPSVAPSPSAPLRRGMSPWKRWALVSVALVGAVLLVLGLTTLSAVGTAGFVIVSSGTGTEPESEPLPPLRPPEPHLPVGPAEPVPAQPVAPVTPAAPVPAQPVQPAPSLPEPSHPAPAQPAPAQPAPAQPAPVDPVPASPDGVGIVRTDERIELRQADHIVAAPSEHVPAGSYEIWADFGRGWTRAGRLEVTAGSAVEVSCNAIRGECRRQ